MRDYPERAECDFTPCKATPPLPLGDDLYPLSIDRTQCAHCEKAIQLSTCLVVNKHMGDEDFEEHFCCEGCANEFYLERLRECGL